MPVRARFRDAAASDHQPTGWPAHGFSDDEATRRLLRSQPPRRRARVGGLGDRGDSRHRRRRFAAACRPRSTCSRWIFGGGADQERGAASLRPTGGDLRGAGHRGAGGTNPATSWSGIGGPDARLLGRGPRRFRRRSACRAHVVTWRAGSTGGPSTWAAGSGRLAELLPPSTRPTCRSARDSPLPVFSPYAQVELCAPRRGHVGPRVWERAFEIFHGPVPAGERTFIQRDFHPGNVLWRRGSGLGRRRLAGGVRRAAVDRRRPLPHESSSATGSTWPTGSRALWEGLTGRSYDPWAEVVSIVGVLDELEEDSIRTARPWRMRLARAIAELSVSTRAG